MAPVTPRPPSRSARTAADPLAAPGAGPVLRPSLRLVAALVVVLFAAALGAGCSDDDAGTEESGSEGDNGSEAGQEEQDEQDEQEEQEEQEGQGVSETTSTEVPPDPEAVAGEAFGYPAEVPEGSGLSIEEAAALPVDDPAAFCERALTTYGTESLNNAAFALAEMEAMADLVPGPLAPDHRLVILGLRADLDVSDPESPNGQAAAGFMERGRGEVLAARARLAANAGGICGEDVISGPPPELPEDQGGGDRDEGPVPDPPPGGFAPE